MHRLYTQFIYLLKDLWNPGNLVGAHQGPVWSDSSKCQASYELLDRSHFKMGGIQYVLCVRKGRRGGLLAGLCVPGLTLPCAYVFVASLLCKLVK